jgi:hypothetical protein
VLRERPKSLYILLRIADRDAAKEWLRAHSYVTVRGGAYFFLPGIAALAYLSERRP